VRLCQVGTSLRWVTEQAQKDVLRRHALLAERRFNERLLKQLLGAFTKADPELARPTPSGWRCRGGSKPLLQLLEDLRQVEAERSQSGYILIVEVDVLLRVSDGEFDISTR